MTDRGSIIKIGENDYELILTTRATKEIAKSVGSFSLDVLKVISSQVITNLISNQLGSKF